MLASPPASYLHDLTDLPKISFNPALTFIQDLMQHNRTLGFLEVLIKWRVVLLILGALSGGVAAYYGMQLDLDRSIEHMFADDDPILAPYQKLQKNFGENELVIAIYSDSELKTEAGKERIKRLAEQATTIPGVISAVTILDPPAAANFDNTGTGAKLRKVFAGYTHNQALDAVGIVCLLSRPQEGDPPRRDTLKQLRALTADLPNGTLVGEPVLIEEAFDLLDADGQRLNTWCTFLLMLTIFLCFRSLRWLILPLVVVQLTLALTRGLLVALHLQLSMVSSMLSAIVTVVGVATVMHVIVRFRDAQEQGLAPADALRKASQLLIAPVIFACLTDAAGFAALMISAVGPVHDFGLMMAIGSVLVLVSVTIVVPGLVLVGNRTDQAPAARGEVALQKLLARLLDWSSHHARLISIMSLLLSALAIWGSTQLVRETDFTRNFREDSSMVQGYQFVEENFGGAGVWDIILPTPARLDKAFFTKVLDLQTRLEEEVPNFNKAMSVGSILDGAIGGMKELRVGAKLAIRTGLRLMRGRLPAFTNTILQTNDQGEPTYLRILLRSPERLEAAQKSAVIQQVQSIATESFPKAEVTGYYVLLNQLIESLLRDQWTTFGVAAIAILIMMVVAFRSVSLAVVTLIPNSLPVLFLFGAMGLLGVRVNMGAAMIAAVSLGLSVDGSIHYVMSYLRMRREGATVGDSLQAVQATVGRAAVFATLALVVGFSTLCVSDFIPTVYFGTLVSLSMIGGLVGNLLVLPLLIQVVDRA